MLRIVQHGILGVLTFLGFTQMAASQAQPPKAIGLEPNYKVRLERSVMIPMRDGMRLAADIYRPDSDGKFPVIMEYQPYRGSSLGGWHNKFAERGFVSVYLSVRGTGGSEGSVKDEYVPQEQQDSYDAIEWLAQQPWANGNVGMTGISYGGFTAIQVAIEQPPHLKAIVPIYATDDRYTDDCHYSQGGNMRMYYDVGHYGGAMVGMNALPPYPELAGEQWAALWRKRLEENEPYLLEWIKRQVDDAYWRHGSLRPAYDRLRCPVFLVAGWRDGYPNAMLRIYTRLKVPKKLLVGPWVHRMPESSVPGPRIDAFNEAARFFAYWLRGEDTGIMKEPPVSIYMQEYAEPERTLDITPGHWRNDADFPVPGAKEMIFYLGENGVLSKQPSDNPQSGYDEYGYIPTVGLANGYWSGGGISYYLPGDQRADEAYSQVYTTAPFDQEVRILGWPQVILHASSSARVATFVAKLDDVAPDGHSALIVDGSLNATRRSSYTDPSPLTPGEIYELSLPVWPTGWEMKPGHRLRLAISSADFPNLWPTPEKARNRIYRERRHSSRVILPVVPESNLPPPRFLPSPQPQPAPSSAGPDTQEVLYDQITGLVTIMRHVSSTTVLDDNLGTVTREASYRCSASSRNPAQASIVGLHRFVLKREDGTIESAAESAIRATENAFHIIINLNVTKNGMPFFHKEWTATEPRRLL